ncbi:hypothetical protein [Microscilla marina]|uniref:Uncharacterized protein n=1 Tax=Microscilla marina ATCC 23134 TaxID=313606 RepID=A1ZT86_MICM2|nr:hypothetical protein [Microscilla marina]EAY26476.1 hypothetical protein M23134_07071 [Microscilla marina ATCC 23134]
MFDFYLTIVKTLVKTEKSEFKNKFNSLVYADKDLSTDEKMFLLEEMQKEWIARQEKKKKNK